MHPLTDYTVAVSFAVLGLALCVLSRKKGKILAGSSILLYMVLGTFQWMAQYMFALLNANLRLCVVWAVILTVMLPLVFEGLGPREQHVSQVRKFFHLVAVILFLPPLRQQSNVVVTEFVAAAGVSVIGLFVVLESLRITKKPFANGLKYILFKIVTPFLDSNDKRALFVSSHIQLLAACVVPPALLIMTDHFPNELVSLSGVLSVGIGDAAASLGGMLCGGKYPLRWNQSKTVPGLVAFILSVLAALKALGLVSITSIVATIITGFAETVFKTYDNLALPAIFSAVALVLA